jgi:U4/U6.U5 tri-snRNP-associated protein 2
LVPVLSSSSSFSFSGFVGLNNIKENDYLNVVVHALAHVPPLRNFFLLHDLSAAPQLAQRFSILVRKLWNPRAFKSHVSPHELLQEVALRSGKRFTLLAQADPVEFLSWFLNHVHVALGGSRTRPGSSIVHKVFQGTLRVESQQITAKADAGDRLRFEEAAQVKVDVSKFLMLTLDLPPAPLFQDEHDRNIIPQVRHKKNLFTLFFLRSFFFSLSVFLRFFFFFLFIFDATFHFIPIAPTPLVQTN